MTDVDNEDEQSRLAKAEQEFEQQVSTHQQLSNLSQHMPVGGMIGRGLGEVVQDMNAEAAADKQMQLEFLKKPEAIEGNVDLAPIKAVDSSFDEHQFVSIARECFEVIHNARVRQQGKLGENELTPEEEAALQSAISEDQAHHLHHLYPGLEIEDARITKAGVINNLEHIAVHFTLKGEQLERDDKSLAVVSGDSTVRTWDELWTYRRDPRVDSAAIDREMTLMENVWWFAHQGWIVEDIKTLTPPH